MMRAAKVLNKTEPARVTLVDRKYWRKAGRHVKNNLQVVYRNAADRLNDDGCLFKYFSNAEKISGNVNL